MKEKRRGAPSGCLSGCNARFLRYLLLSSCSSITVDELFHCNIEEMAMVIWTHSKLELDVATWMRCRRCRGYPGSVWPEFGRVSVIGSVRMNFWSIATQEWIGIIQ